MKSNLTNSDYVSILNYYKMPIPSSKSKIKTHAESIMSDKLCRCIKKVDDTDEAKSIRICTKSIFQNRGYKRGKFGCKKKKYLTFKKYGGKKKDTRKRR